MGAAAAWLLVAWQAEQPRQSGRCKHAAGSASGAAAACHGPGVRCAKCLALRKGGALVLTGRPGRCPRYLSAFKAEWDPKDPTERLFVCGRWAGRRRAASAQRSVLRAAAGAMQPSLKGCMMAGSGGASASQPQPRLRSCCCPPPAGRPPSLLLPPPPAPPRAQVHQRGLRRRGAAPRRPDGRLQRPPPARTDRPQPHHHHARQQAAPQARHHHQRQLQAGGAAAAATGACPDVPIVRGWLSCSSQRHACDQGAATAAGRSTSGPRRRTRSTRAPSGPPPRRRPAAAAASSRARGALCFSMPSPAR